MHVLIIMTYFQILGITGGEGVSITTQEFKTKIKCTSAKEAMDSAAKSWRVGNKVLTFCVPK